MFFRAVPSALTIIGITVAFIFRVFFFYSSSKIQLPKKMDRYMLPHKHLNKQMPKVNIWLKKLWLIRNIHHPHLTNIFQIQISLSYVHDKIKSKLPVHWSRGTWVQSQVASYQKLFKWCLIPPCLTLSNIRYVSRVKWNDPEKGVAPSPTPRCSSYWKGSLLVALDYGRQILLYCLLRITSVTFIEWKHLLEAI